MNVAIFSGIYILVHFLSRDLYFKEKGLVTPADAFGLVRILSESPGVFLRFLFLSTGSTGLRSGQYQPSFGTFVRFSMDTDLLVLKLNYKI